MSNHKQRYHFLHGGKRNPVINLPWILNGSWVSSVFLLSEPNRIIWSLIFIWSISTITEFFLSTHAWHGRQCMSCSSKNSKNTQTNSLIIRLQSNTQWIFDFTYPGCPFSDGTTNEQQPGPNQLKPNPSLITVWGAAIAMLSLYFSSLGTTMMPS